MNYNRCMLAGHLGKDPELRYTSNGNAVLNFSLAVTRRWKGKDGSKKEETSWIDGEVWGNSAENFQKYCQKGTNVFIDGAMKQESWEDKNTGKKRSKIVITVLGWQTCGQSGEQQETQQNRPAEPDRREVVDDSEVPF